MVSPLSPRDARSKFPHAYLDLNNGAFERSPLSLLDRDLRQFYYEMPSMILALLYELVEFKRRIDPKDPEGKSAIASDALARCLAVLSKQDALDYQLFILVVRQFFLLFGSMDRPILGHSSNGKELIRNKKELIPKAVIPKTLLSQTINAFIRIHQKQLYKSDSQIEHFLFLIPSYKAYGFTEFFEVFCGLINKDMSVYEFETQLKFILYCLNLVQRDAVEYNLLKCSEAIFLKEIKDSGIKRSISFRYFMHSLSHNEIDLSMLNVWMHVFSQLSMDDLSYIRNESMLFLYNRFSLVEPVIVAKRWYVRSEVVVAAGKVLSHHRLISKEGPPPTVLFDRGLLKIAGIQISDDAAIELRRIPGVREIVSCQNLKLHQPLTETINILKTVKFLLDGPVIDLDAMRGFVNYFHSFIPHGELTEKESKTAARLYRDCFKDSVFEEKDRLYLELVYRNPFPKSLKKWDRECDWEKEACKLVNDYMSRQYPIHVVEKNIAALYRFFLTKKDYEERAPLILRDLYFEVQKKSPHALDKIKWLIKGLEHEPIDEEQISPFLCTLPEVFLSNSKIPLKTHIRLITLMRKCYKLSNKLVDGWLKKFIKVHVNFKAVSFADLLALVELFKQNEYSLDEWKNIAVILMSLPISDALITTYGTVDAVSATVDEIKEKLFDSFSSTYERHRRSSQFDSFNIQDFTSDLKDQYYINCIKCFMNEIQNLERSTVQSIIRFNDVLQQRCLEDIMRKAVMATPDKLKAMEAQLTACKLIERYFGFLTDNEQTENDIRKKLKFMGNYAPVSVMANLIFASKIRGLKNRSLFISIWLKQFVQMEVINFKEWHCIADHLKEYSYTCEEWTTLVRILDVIIEDNLTLLSPFLSFSLISDPIDVFMTRFKIDYSTEQKEDTIDEDLKRIKDKYYLNVLMNLVRENSLLRPHNERSLNRCDMLIKFCYMNLSDEKERAEQYIQQNYQRPILLPK